MDVKAPLFSLLLGPFRHHTGTTGGFFTCRSCQLPRLGTEAELDRLSNRVEALERWAALPSFIYIVLCLALVSQGGLAT